MSAGLPLSTLLSQVLVAFTIEFDNEFERQMPHRTTNQGSTPGVGQGPWLVSMVMWSNCMRFVGEAGVGVAELEGLARTKTNLNGMERWGYIDVAPAPADTRPKPPQSAWVIRATAMGRKAQQVWGPLFSAIEARWQARFGDREIDELRKLLWAVVSKADVELPDCLPILGYGLYSKGPDRKGRAPAARAESTGSGLPLMALLSRVLLAFAIEFESEPGLSLAICANVLRILDAKGVRVRDLPLLSGVSKEAISMAMGILQKSGVAVVEPELAHQPPGRRKMPDLADCQSAAGCQPAPQITRAKVARLTVKGLEAPQAYRRRLGIVEDRWQARLGKETVRELRESLERLVGEPTADRSPLFRGLEPYPDGWRASVPKPHTLPHYPMVLHRGGFPDGS